MKSKRIDPTVSRLLKLADEIDGMCKDFRYDNGNPAAMIFGSEETREHLIEPMNKWARKIRKLAHEL